MLSMVTAMLRNSVLVMLTVATSSPAAVNISYTGVPTPFRPGHVTFRVTATTDTGFPIQAFDFATQPQFGLFGPMNQENPGGNATVFQDWLFTGIFPGPEQRDSHFLFVTTTLTIPPGYSSESETSLRSVFASPTPIGPSVPFVQLVIPPLGTVQAVGQITEVPPGGAPPIDNNVSFSITNPFPEPSTVSLFGLAVFMGIGFVRNHRGSASARR
jgi:hypothetical protein